MMIHEKSLLLQSLVFLTYYGVKSLEKPDI
jgi:hypothetical protein